MVLHLPASRTLGGARIQVELADALRAAGQEVDFLSATDVWDRDPSNRLAALVRTFSRESRPALRRIAARYDVVDALEGCITLTKRQLPFDGVLVARSLGLRDAYARWRDEAARVHADLRGRREWRWARGARRRYDVWEGRVSRRNADGFFVPNQAEYDELLPQLGADRLRCLPFALPDSHRAALADVARRRDGAAPTVSFLGTWDARKGRHDFPAIVQRVRAAHRDAHFRFIGTYASEQRVLRDLALEPCPWISVTPAFEPSELPDLLAGVTVAAFPSYVEGFGFAVLEQIAAGIPVVAYDIPGPRDIIAPLRTDLLVPPGAASELADRLIAELGGATVSPEACIRRAADFSWHSIAAETIEAYDSWRAISPSHPQR